MEKLLLCLHYIVGTENHLNLLKVLLKMENYLNLNLVVDYVFCSL